MDVCHAAARATARDVDREAPAARASCTITNAISRDGFDDY